ncbi:MAG: tRNA (guanine37-N1)-methyltransferase [Parcubacteria group bacterium Greene0714_21]|nr:MAG: tRNA (guanine37-N1)-methyltransferase [Parcubacteria group bacterium Greene0416_39]TSC98532.1 MAG: tRNA (guanine37-N1)-methyltransferase [Parcubacteria group bacterium Greene1014_47]TSD04293.1 MAG: tRNA (guanine37-N1)-methyltransferase [Parcubacteria group bacterium Greene0714_21]
MQRKRCFLFTMITFDVITIFPELVEAFGKESLLKRAQKKKLLKIQAHDLRKWAKDKHKTVDDKPFGGGLGMVLRIEPIYKAVTALKSEARNSKSETNSKFKSSQSKTILFTPRGKKFTQKMAYEFSKFNQLIFICGRYEGVDERVAKHIADEELSIGDYVLMGGEIPAMTVIEAVARLIPGVVGKPAFLKERLIKGSGGPKNGFIEYPQYTRPETFKEWRVPRVLVSGNHQKIGEWKAKHGQIVGKQ